MFLNRTRIMVDSSCKKTSGRLGIKCGSWKRQTEHDVLSYACSDRLSRYRSGAEVDLYKEYFDSVIRCRIQLVGEVLLPC